MIKNNYYGLNVIHIYIYKKVIYKFVETLIIEFYLKIFILITLTDTFNFTTYRNWSNVND